MWAGPPSPPPPSNNGSLWLCDNGWLVRLLLCEMHEEFVEEQVALGCVLARQSRSIMCGLSHMVMTDCVTRSRDKKPGSRGLWGRKTLASSWR